MSRDETVRNERTPGQPRNRAPRISSQGTHLGRGVGCSQEAHRSGTQTARPNRGMDFVGIAFGILSLLTPPPKLRQPCLLPGLGRHGTLGPTGGRGGGGGGCGPPDRALASRARLGHEVGGAGLPGCLQQHVHRDGWVALQQPVMASFPGPRPRGLGPGLRQESHRAGRERHRTQKRGTNRIEAMNLKHNAKQNRSQNKTPKFRVIRKTSRTGVGCAKRSSFSVAGYDQPSGC